MTKQHLQDILSAPFDLDNWRNTLAEIFNVKHFHQQPQQILLPSNDKAAAAFELGHFETADERLIGLYQVNVLPGVMLERNKVGLRALLRNVYRYDVDGALIVFVQDEKWRLSFVSEVRALDEDGNISKIATEPKRYTYLLGRDEKTRTPTDRLYAIAGKPQTLEDIRNAFSVEALNEEFYKTVARYFYQLVGATAGKGKKAVTYERILELPGIDATNNDSRKLYQEFAVRLIGRIIFCWFLKMKKSDDGFPLLPEELLSSKAVKSKQSFYHTILERLFFQTLNTPMDERVEGLPKGCEITPFLNGGLFEPHPDDFYRPDDLTGLNKNLNTLRIPDDWFLEFFTELEKYNFTIDENSVVDIEVSVDPEMLGRIFENLLAEIDPDSGETARKATGSYYTPREIVDYMATESLLYYLNSKTGIEIDTLRPIFKMDESVSFNRENRENILNALDKLTVLDPACGSGAFPIGVMQKIVMALQKLDPDARWWKERQISRIENAILQKQVREKLDTASMEYARKLGIIQNSLFGVDIQPIAAEISKLRCFLTLVVDETIDDRKSNRGVEALPNLEFKFVTADTLIPLPEATTKQGMGFLFDNQNELNELSRLRKQYLQSYGQEKEAIKTRFLETQKKIFKQQIQSAAASDERALKISMWNPFDHSKTDWFDPEWMLGERDFDIVIGNPPYRQLSKDENISKTYKEYLKYRYNTSGGRLNTFIFFLHNGLELLTSEGILCFIIPNTILTQEYYSYTRKQLLTNHTLLEVVNYINMPFKNAVVENVTLFIRKSLSTNYNVNIYNDNLRKSELISQKPISSFMNSKNFVININTNSIIDSIFEKGFDSVGNLCYVNQAIALKGDKTRSIRYENKDGKYYRLLDGRNINRYSISWDGIYLDYDIRRIHSCKRKDIFITDEKLFFRRVSSNLIFTYDNEKYFALNTLVVVNLKEHSKVKIKYLLAILNSSLLNYIYKLKFKSTKKVFSEIQARSVKELPIIITSKTIQSVFCSIVDYLLLLNKMLSGIHFDEFVTNNHLFKIFDYVIDAMVFELYFEEDFKKAGITFIPQVERDFPSIDGLSDEEKIETIGSVYQKLRQKDNEIMNNLKLMDIRLADLIGPIKAVG